MFENKIEKKSICIMQKYFVLLKKKRKNSKKIFFVKIKIESEVNNNVQ